MTLSRALKPKKCRHCAEVFTPQRMGQIACGYQCALAITRLQQTRELKRKRLEQSRELRARKEAIKPRSKWVQETQVEFNKYIRARDAGLPCISCGTSQGQMQAGHYKPTGSHPELRFSELNCHAQCSTCNNYKSGNLTQYRIGLIARIGLPLVEFLEGAHKPLKLTIDELKALKAYYKQRTKEALAINERATP